MLSYIMPFLCSDNKECEKKNYYLAVNDRVNRPIVLVHSQQPRFPCVCLCCLGYIHMCYANSRALQKRCTR